MAVFRSPSNNMFGGMWSSGFESSPTANSKSELRQDNSFPYGTSNSTSSDYSWDINKEAGSNTASGLNVASLESVNVLSCDTVHLAAFIPLKVCHFFPSGGLNEQELLANLFGHAEAGPATALDNGVGGGNPAGGTTDMGSMSLREKVRLAKDLYHNTYPFNAGALKGKPLQTSKAEQPQSVFLRH